VELSVHVDLTYVGRGLRPPLTADAKASALHGAPLAPVSDRMRY